MPVEEAPRAEKLSERIADAEERLRQSIAQRIERNRTELARLQHEQELFDSVASPLASALGVGHKIATSKPVGRVFDDSDEDDGARGAAPDAEERGGRPQSAGPPAVTGGSAATGEGHSRTGSRGHTSPRTPPTTHGNPGEGEGAASARDAMPPPEERGPVLLKMTVDIGDGRQGEVRVRRGDVPESLAAAFCERHGLAERARQLLTEHIKANMSDVAKPKPDGASTRAGGADGGHGQRSGRGEPRGQQRGGEQQGGSQTARGGARGAADRGSHAPTPRQRGYGDDGWSRGGRGEAADASQRSRPRPASAPRPRAKSAPRETFRRGGFGHGRDEQAWEHSRSQAAASARGESRGGGMPSINARSRYLAERRRRHSSGSIFTRLHENAAELEARRQHMRYQNEENELASLTPQPSVVSETSRRYLAMRHEEEGDVGKRLHEEGKAQRTRRDAAARAAKAQVDPEATFAPTVGEGSQALLKISGRGDGDGGLSIWELQHLEAEQRKHERHQLMQLYESEHSRESSHRPTVTAASRRIEAAARGRTTAGMGRSGSAPPSRRCLPPRVEASRDQVPIHESLFADAREKRRALLRREAEREADIEAQSRSLSAKTLRPEAFHRLCYAHRQKEIEMTALRDYLQRHEDPHTGRPLFMPKITRGPKAERPPSPPALITAAGSADPSRDPSPDGSAAGRSLATGDDGSVAPPERYGLQAHRQGDSGLISGASLHTARVKARKSREILAHESKAKAEASAKLPTTGAFTKGYSEQLVRSMRDSRLKELFTSLDVEGDGVINGERVEAALPTMPADIAEALRPALASFRGEFLAFSDFKALVSRALSSSAAPGPRRYLLPDRGETSVYMAMKEKAQREQQSECSFRPKMNNRSQRLASSKRQPGMPIDEHLRAAQAEYQARKNAAQRARASEVDRECTFQPKLTARGLRAPSSPDGPRGPHAKPPGKVFRSRPLSTEQRDINENCTFRPRTNYYPGARRRIDCDNPHAPPPPGHYAMGNQYASANASTASAYSASNAHAAYQRGDGKGYADADSGAAWGVYDPPVEVLGAHDRADLALSEADLARILQSEIESEVARLTMGDTPAAAGAPAAATPAVGEGRVAELVRRMDDAAGSGGGDAVVAGGPPPARSGPPYATREGDEP